MAQVEIRNVRKSFGAVEVLHGVSVDIGDGEFVVLVGPSGCGKSTLLRLVAGLEKITAGDVLIEGHRVNALPPKDRNIAMVFQNYALYPHMTVAQNIGFPLRMAGVAAAETARQVERAADTLGLKPLLDRYPRHLSGGQRQRVAMGRAIVRQPAAFLFDEPLSNLDAQLRAQMRTELKELLQTLETTALYVTHDQVEAMTMADRVVVMRDGVIEQIGTPLDLYDRPVNTFVARFIGLPAMNLLPGVVAAGRDALHLDDGVALPFGPAGDVPTENVVFGFRSETIAVDDAEGIPARVAVIEPMGGQTQVLFKFGGRDIVGTFSARMGLKVGQQVRLRPDMALAHFFTAADGRRIAIERDRRPAV
jgi:multiple sugar transport system ATP-binding protein